MFNISIHFRSSPQRISIFQHSMTFPSQDSQEEETLGRKEGTRHFVFIFYNNLGRSSKNGLFTINFSGVAGRVGGVRLTLDYGYMCSESSIPPRCLLLLCHKVVGW